MAISSCMGLSTSEFRETKADRNARWVREYRSGDTTRDIAERDGCTRQRVQQVLRDAGVSGSDGGAAKGGGRLAAKSTARKARIAAHKAAIEAKRKERFEQTGMPTGVSLHNPSGLYRAQARSRWLPGYHKTIESAVAARMAALEDQHG